MTPEYLITDEMLAIWRKGCIDVHSNDDNCHLCEHRGRDKREGCCDFDDDAMEKMFRSHPHSNHQSEQPKFNSTDLLLLANDEWKRREERKHNHEHIPWTAGFINGFLTDRKWAREYIDKLRKQEAPK